jgi:hypothetical protein
MNESSLESHEATLTTQEKDFEDAHASVLAREIVANVKESAIDNGVTEVADREKRLVKQQMQELAIAHKRLEDLQAAYAGEAQKVWDFLGQAESALVPIGFNPLRSEVPVQEVSAELPLLDSAGQDPQVSLEPVVQGPAEEVPDVAQVDVQETMKLVAEWFEHQPEDA